MRSTMIHPLFFDHEFPEEIAEIKQQIQKTEDATREKVRISMEFFSAKW